MLGVVDLAISGNFWIFDTAVTILPFLCRQEFVPLLLSQIHCTASINCLTVAMQYSRANQMKAAEADSITSFPLDSFFNFVSKHIKCRCLFENLLLVL